MTLNELRYIVALARERHFGRAAEACFVSQPTLSVAVRKLEDELGVTLFERGTREVALTAVGGQVVAQARRVLEDADEVRRVAESGRDPLAQPLRLGVIHTVGPYLLPHLIPILHRQAPRMPLVVHEDYTAQLATRLRDHELDAIVISLPFDAPGVVTRTLYEEPFLVVLPAAHPWAERKTVRREDLADEQVLLLGAGHCFRDQVLEACPQCMEPGTLGTGIQKTLEGSSLETIRYMVASGMGVTVLPCTAVGADRFSQRLLAVRRFTGRAPRRQVALAWREGFARTDALEVLARAVAECPLTCVRML